MSKRYAMSKETEMCCLGYLRDKRIIPRGDFYAYIRGPIRIRY